MSPERLDRVLSSSRLPTLPTVAIEILELVQQDDVEVKAIAHAISHDAALSSKILKTVNSSYYSQLRQVSTISQAVIVLGTNGVKTLALGFCLARQFKASPDQGFDNLTIWQRSVYTAVAARTLAKHLRLEQIEEVFLGGLFQDLGVLALTQVLGHEYQQIAKAAGQNHDELLRLEQQNLQVDHAEVGAALAESWNLPPVLVEPIRYHAQPDQGPESLRPVIRCVAMGNDVADLFIDPSVVSAVASYRERAERWFGLGRDESESLLTTIHQETVEIARLFDLPAETIENPEVILNQANEAMLEISLEQQRQNQLLAQELMTDPLTGVANRRRLDVCVKEQFNLVHAAAGVLSLLFLDIDDFKGVNDQYGHMVGDRVLIATTNAIKATVPSADLVARFGGDEFAIVLAHVDQAEAARRAQSVRQQILDQRIVSEGHPPLKISVSIGVATYVNGCFECSKQLFLAADQALYAAKAGGRNRVQAFKPESCAQIGQDAHETSGS